MNDGWMKAWMDEFIDEWMHGWMNAWMNALLPFLPLRPLCLEKIGRLRIGSFAETLGITATA